MKKKFEFIDDPVSKTFEEFITKHDSQSINESEKMEPAAEYKPTLADQELQERIHIGGLKPANQRNVHYAVVMRQDIITLFRILSKMRRMPQGQMLREILEAWFRQPLNQKFLNEFKTRYRGEYERLKLLGIRF